LFGKFSSEKLYRIKFRHCRYW